MHKSIYNGRFRAELHAKKPRLATAHGSPLQLCNLLVARSNNVLYTVMHRDEQIWLVGLLKIAISVEMVCLLPHNFYDILDYTDYTLYV